MSSHDDDILDFDFFEDDATRETHGRRRRRARRVRAPVGGGGGGGPRRPQLRAPHGLTPILRLIGLVAFAILIVVLLVVWGQGCSSDKKRNDYSGAMTDIGTIGAELRQDRHRPRRAPDDAGAQAGGARDAARRA